MGLKCFGKKRYDTLRDAVRTAVARTNPLGRSPSKFLQPYECEHGCGGFHITSKPYRYRVAEYPVIGDWKP
jgi:hypothetical protein